MNKRPSFFVRMPLRSKFIRMRLPHSLKRRFASYSMFGDISHADQLYIACGYTDMRKSIDGLIHLVQHQLQLNPFQNHLFLFCGRKRDRMKALYWEGDGFVLLYKRLESGQYQWPMDAEAVRSITPQEFRWLLEGLSIHQPKAVKKLGFTPSM
ncbi:IS66 family insertion sequence element accessory protein TnpB [Paenibacillaceae bacterium WGS1546]|uniref:IS66 family insertion sequence element accessory protein TnpB n=1 Tax=Cohnella sp. WGS1546 TaxID=3366810 RepID=UPI00372D87F8